MTGETVEFVINEELVRATENLAAANARYERGLRAIAACSLEGTDFGDYVQSLVHDLLEGNEAECWNCGLDAHEGSCVDPETTEPGSAQEETEL